MYNTAREAGDSSTVTSIQKRQFTISLSLSCLSCVEGKNCVDENMNGIVEYSHRMKQLRNRETARQSVISVLSPVFCGIVSNWKFDTFIRFKRGKEKGRPFPSCFEPHYKSEAIFKTFHVKI